ncbi:MAG: Kae1-associated serine/threonine protein kinase [Candidatus Aenigmarchaeota archaeon]|nr:Kae1-associated serine/threonine protein kinase [Candidatus Aenigmarchaeota archaeon]
MQIIYRGAEAVIYLDNYDNQKVLVKERIKKNYRLDEIDTKIRKFRLRKEVRLLTEARKNGVPTPKIFETDEVSNKIIMEYVEGTRIKDLLNSADEKTVTNICNQIGRLIGKLHSAGIIHGDLTTSNMILKDNDIYFIDFGLGEFSRRIEDQGVDMNLLKEAIQSTHFNILKTCWNNLLKGYRQEYKNSEQVIKKVDEIENRARYVKRKEQV